jgi:hypothetical protein
VVEEDVRKLRLPVARVRRMMDNSVARSEILSGTVPFLPGPCAHPSHGTESYFWWLSPEGAS